MMAKTQSNRSRFLDFVFGGALDRAERQRILASQPSWARHAVTGLYSLCMVLYLFWGLGALGWLPLARESFTMGWLLAINGIGVVAAFARDGVEKHYQRKARRAEATAPQ